MAKQFFTDIDVTENKIINLADPIDPFDAVNIHYLQANYEALSQKGVPGGYAPLNQLGLIDSQYLPSYVDDVVEYPNFASFPPVGETGKLYIALSTNNIYRWSGTVYVQISTSSTAGVWGLITGVLTNQVDLISYLSNNYQPRDSDLAAIAGLSGSNGLLRKTANVWGLDTATYLTTETDPTVPSWVKAITSLQIIGWDLVHTELAGGTAGQILAKAGAANYDLEWIDNYTSQVRHEVKLAEPIAAGQAVYVSGASGTNMLVSKADNTSDATSSKTMGLLMSGGTTNDTRFVVTEGLLAGLNTSTAQVGDPVWLNTNGNLIYGLANKPHAPRHLVYIGIVTRVNANNGEIFIHIQNGFELNELHDVELPTTNADYINKGILYRDKPNDLWKHNTIEYILGYTPYNASNPAGYITTAALSGYATELWVTNQGYQTAAQVAAAISSGLTGYATQAWVTSQGYLTSYTETDPIFGASAAAGITAGNITNWNNAFSWGNHSSAGYLTGITSGMISSALGYTPYSSANPSAYQTSTQVNAAISSALGSYIPTSSIGANGGVAPLDVGGFLPSSNFPGLSGDISSTNYATSLQPTAISNKGEDLFPSGNDYLLTNKAGVLKKVKISSLPSTSGVSENDAIALSLIFG